MSRRKRDHSLEPRDSYSVSSLPFYHLAAAWQIASSLRLPPYSARNWVEFTWNPRGFCAEWVTKKTTKTTLGFFVERGMRNERGMDARNSPRVTCDTSHISAMQNCKHNHLRQYGGHLIAFWGVCVCVCVCDH